MRGAGWAALVAVTASGVAGCDRVLGLDPVTPHSRVALVLDNRSSGSDLDRFPLLVPLGPDVISYDLVHDPSVDLRFYDEVTAADLPFEVEHWDPSGESDVWVLVPHIPAHSSTTRIVMYVGAEAHGAANPGAVWSDYGLVFHGDALVNSAGPSATPALVPDPVSSTPPSIAPGAIGNAVAFTGLAGQGVDFQNSGPLLAGWPAFTVELLLYLDYPDLAGGDEYRVISKDFGGIINGRVRNSIRTQPSPYEMQSDFPFPPGTLYPIIYVPDRVWTQVTYSYDGQILWVYRDGVVIDVFGNDAVAPSGGDASSDLGLGGTGGAVAVTGRVDEVRLSQVYRNPDWAFAQFLAMTRHFITFEDL